MKIAKSLGLMNCLIVEQASSLWTGKMPIPRLIFNGNQLLIDFSDKSLSAILKLVIRQAITSYPKMLNISLIDIIVSPQ